MRQLFILLTLILCSINVGYAQNNFVGGSLNVNNSDFNGDHYDDFRISVYTGRSINENLDLAIQLGYYGLPYEKDYSISFIARYNTFKVSNLDIFLQPHIGYTLRNIRLDESFKYHINSYNIGLNLGTAYQLNKSFRARAFIGGLNYSFGKDDHEIVVDERKNFNFNLDLTDITVGLEYLF